MIANQRLGYLFQQRLLQKNTSEEKRELLILMADPGNEDDVKELLGLYWEEFNGQEAKSEDVFQPGQGEEILNRLLEEHVYPTQTAVWTVRLWPHIAAIVAAIAVIVSSIYFFNYSNNRTKDIQTTSYINDIAPGKVGAILTLANGKKISLTDVRKGKLAEEAGTSITKTADGQVVYEVEENSRKSDKINTLTTAQGETYILTLPDKSKVWMNAATSLTYSTALNERGKRRVKLSGEAYFEISKDKAHPFVVESRGQEVEVLGTHFNINSYSDEPDVKTTLVEGSVKIKTKGRSDVLKPGQQSVLTDNSISINEVDTEMATAWKDGLFIFNDEPLQDVMRRVARWYDVEVIYEGVDPTELYWGRVSRYDKVSKVLRKLELTGGVHFKIEGRTIIVMK